MSLVYPIGGVDYVPLRAVPLITSGALSAARLAHMISEPDAFCDPAHDTVISPVRITASGALLHVDHRAFRHHLSARASAKAPRLLGCHTFPSGLLVRLADIRAMHDQLIEQNKILPGQATFDPAPTLSTSERQLVLDGLKAPRKNSAESIRHALGSAFQTVEAACLAKGLDLHRDALPGKKSDWRPVFDRLVPRLGQLTQETFSEHCKAIGLRWQQGTVKADVAAFQRIIQESNL